MMKEFTKKATGMLLLVAAPSLLSSCNPLQKEEARISKTLSLRLDPELTPTERKVVIEDLQRLIGLELQVQEGSHFNHIFSGTTGAAPVSYLKDRLNYILPSSAELSRRVEVEPASNPQQTEANAAASPTLGVAANVGTTLWMNSLLVRPDRSFLRVGKLRAELTDSRVGAVQLGSAYVRKDEDGRPLIPGFDRMSAWIHEARHSDCTRGLTGTDVERIRQGRYPENLQCGHLHVICPEGHAFAGAPACDATPWGAYSVQGIYASTMSQRCTTCTEQEKAEALANAIDALSRVLVLADMLEGKYGPPDMTSAGLQETNP